MLSLTLELERGGPVGSWREINSFCREKPARRYAYFHLRYQSALGLGSRLLLLAILMGAREIGFVGLDGVSESGPLHLKDGEMPRADDEARLLEASNLV